MDDFLKLALAFAGAYLLFRVTEEPPSIAPYYVPYYFPWISNRYFLYGAGGGGFPFHPVAPIPRPPLGDGEGIEMGGGGHGGGHER